MVSNLKILFSIKDALKCNDYNGINIFLLLENPCTFMLAKEKTWKSSFNISSELSQNHGEK